MTSNCAIISVTSYVYGCFLGMSQAAKFGFFSKNFVILG